MYNVVKPLHKLLLALVLLAAALVATQAASTTTNATVSEQAPSDDVMTFSYGRNPWGGGGA